MQIAHLPVPDPLIYDSLDALDDYLSCIRLCREHRQRMRAEVKRLGIAIGKVTAELEATLQDEDCEIVRELQGVLKEFENRLQRAQVPISSAVVSSGAAAALSELGIADAGREAEAAVKDEVTAALCVAAVQAVVIDQEEGEDQTPSAAVHALISDAETALWKEGWLAEIDALSTRWNELDKEGLRLKESALNRPACFRLRAQACSLARIQAQAEQMGLGFHIKDAVTALRDKMELARTYAGDTTDVLPFHPRLWTDNGALLPMEAWDELVDLYAKTAEAQEAWDWYARLQDAADAGSQHALVNAIGAAQQTLFRALKAYGGADRLQGDLYGGLREATGAVGFLRSLSMEVTWDELIEMGLELPDLLVGAQKAVAAAREKREKEARKIAAIQAVVEWQKDYKALPVSTAAATQAKARLLPLLDACIGCGVPATNVQVRGALLESAPLLLQDLPPYAKFLDAALTERKRKGVDVVAVETENAEEEDLPDAQVAESLEWVRVFSEHQKVMILGGSARSQVAEKLKQMLLCPAVEWIDSKKGDRMSKFKNELIRSDIVIVVKKFASHEMTEKGREWAKEYGKAFVLLPSGYGVNQIVHQMFLQLVSPDMNARAETPSSKSGGPTIANLNLVC